MNLVTEHTTYKRAGVRNVLNVMCKSFEEMWPKSVLRNSGGYPQEYRRGYQLLQANTVVGTSILNTARTLRQYPDWCPSTRW